MNPPTVIYSLISFYAKNIMAAKIHQQIKEINGGSAMSDGLMQKWDT